MRTRTFTKAEVDKAYQACIDPDNSRCEKCPISCDGPCADLIVWANLPGTPDWGKMRMAAYELLCDPLYVDIMKVKEV